jgi:Domain of unknown function (DUF1929)
MPFADIFKPIPDWGSLENQGGAIAVTDLNSDGRPDVLVFQVDNAPGKNRGLYRVGRDLDADGVATGGWGPWMEVPNWFSFENQGAGLAVADLNGSGQPDLVVFTIDAPNQENRGVFQIGRNLDAGGVATGGWTGWQNVPDWFSWENDGGAIAVGDFTGTGQHDLVVFMIDAPPGANRGLFRIGRNLDALGQVQGGWSDWIEVPQWFSDSNAGAGVAVGDLTNAGQRDLIVFQIDDAPTQNQAFYKIARKVAATGEVRDGWSPWYGVPGWASWENQGGSIALASSASAGGGAAAPSHDLLVLAIDSPPGENAGLLQVLPLDNRPAERGEWKLLTFDSQLLAVHGAVLPNGKVLFFAGSGNSGVRFFSPQFGNIADGVACSVVWDYATSAISGKAQFFSPNTLRNGNNKPVDYFCGGECFVADGRLLQAGGTLDYDVDAHNNPGPHGFFGRRGAVAFDFQTEQWSKAGSMAGGRWYPTLIPLGDGRVLAASGLGEDGNLNPTLEIFSPNTGAAGTWQTLPTPPNSAQFNGFPLYAHLILLADGRIFFTGGRMDDDQRNSAPCLVDLHQNPVRVTSIGGLVDAASRNQSASVLLGPAQEQKVLIIGGATAAGEENATDSVDVISLKNLADVLPQYERAAALLLPRVHLNAVLLPDRTVFVSGGALQREGGPTERRKILARYQSEIFDSAQNRWALGATAQVERLYHSIALLLPDGRVVAASGNPDKGGAVQWGEDKFNEELRLEVYSPPYLFRGPRPTITAVPNSCAYGQTITIQSPQAGDIRWVHLMRPCATTHSFDSDQRLVEMNIASKDAGTIQAALTNNPNIAPPGWYMLFLVDQKGVPSVSSWVKVG